MTGKMRTLNFTIPLRMTLQIVLEYSRTLPTTLLATMTQLCTFSATLAKTTMTSVAMKTAKIYTLSTTL